MRCREHHREPLAVVEHYAPVGPRHLPLELLLVSPFAEMGYRDRSEVVDAFCSGHLRGAENHPDRRRVRRAQPDLGCPGIEIEILPSKTEHLAHPPAQAEQQRHCSAESQILGRSDQCFGVGGGEGSTCFHTLRPRSFDEVERVAGIKPNFTASVNAWRQLSSVEVRTWCRATESSHQFCQLGDRRLTREPATHSGLRNDVSELHLASGFILHGGRTRNGSTFAVGIAVDRSPEPGPNLAVQIGSYGLEVERAVPVGVLRNNLDVTVRSGRSLASWLSRLGLAPRLGCSATADLRSNVRSNRTTARGNRRGNTPVTAVDVCELRRT